MAKVIIKKKRTVRLLASGIIVFTALAVFLGGFLIAVELGLIEGESFSEGGNPLSSLNPFAAGAKPFEDDKLTMLIMGTDGRHDAGGRSDTIMLAYLDMKEKSVRLLSIPRDTRVEIPGRPYKEKINHAYVYGGPELVLETINSYLDTDYEHYATINFENFARIVDTLDGVEMDVPERMYYPAEDIDLRSGLQTLDGHDALSFVRYRGGSGGDYSRMERQQEFLKQLAREVQEVRNVWTATQLANTGAEMVRTNLNLSEMIYIANSMLEMEVDNIEGATVPGGGRTIEGVWYHEADWDEFENLDRTFREGPSPEDEEEESDEED